MSNSDNPLIIPKAIDSSIVFEESLIKIKRDQLVHNNQLPYSYYTLEIQPFAVVILAILNDGTLLLIEEYRHPTKQVILGCPAGYMNENESPLAAAKRELLEETGYQAETFELIGSAYPYAGTSNQKNFFVLAKGASYLKPPELEQSEIIRIRLMTIDQLNKAIKNHCEMDGNLGTALFFHSCLN